MNQQATLFDLLTSTPPPRFDGDICNNRHKGSPESIAANPSESVKREAHLQIMNLLALRPRTAKELAEAMHTRINCISGRCSELRQMGKVEKTGLRRDGSAELRLI